MDASRLIDALKQQGPSSPLQSLAQLTVELWLDRPLSALVTPAVLGRWLGEGLRGLTTPALQGALQRWVEAVANPALQERRRLKELAPPDVRHALKDAVARPYSPDRQVVLTIIDRPATRELVRAVLVSTLLDFARKASAPVTGAAKGLGTLARMATESMKSRGGGLGGLVGVLSDEVERTLERRTLEFADAALAGIFAQVADVLADPRRASEAAELRVALIDGALELSGRQLARELVNLDVPGQAEVARLALKRWLSSPGAPAALESAAKALLDAAGAATLRQALDEVDAQDSFKALAVEVVAAGLRPVVESQAFEAWLGAVLQPR